MHLLLLLCALCTIFPAHADIYKCRKADGAIYYQDRPCARGDVLQDIDRRDINVLHLELRKQREASIKARSRELRQQLAAERRQDREQKRRLRLHVKCERVKQQIALLNQRYRHGYTLKQGLVLDRKMAECNFRKQQYCTNEQPN